MYELLLKLHSWWAWLAMLVLFAGIINALMGYGANRDYEAKDLRISLFGLIFTHIQLVLGLLLYFVSPMGLKVLGEMKNETLRLTSLEHPLVNIIAIVLITIGWSQHKKAHMDDKFKKILIFYSLGFILLMSRIPWVSWLS
ncbi:MAG: hypothetical protein J0M25_05280 [Flavobacteriales bacterium]|nr:hypothetical protein [Flavobacteriales bacterium]